MWGRGLGSSWGLHPLPRLPSCLEGVLRYPPGRGPGEGIADSREWGQQGSERRGQGGKSEGSGWSQGGWRELGVLAR